MTQGSVSILAVSLERISLEELESRALGLGIPLLDPAASGRQRQYLAGRIAAMQLLREQGIPPQIEADLSLGYLRCPEGYISISHTEGLALAAWATSPVGIDVEVAERDATRVIRRFLTPKETQWLDQSTYPNPALTLWVLKESVSKACGLGMSLGMTEFEVTEKRDGIFTSPIPPSAPYPLKKATIALLPWDDHLVALCTEAEDMDGDLSIRPLKIED